MAIQKGIKKANGVTVSYHRIAMIKVEVNQQVTVLVESYIDAAGRAYEKEYMAGRIEGEPVFPYTHSEYLSFGYDESDGLFSGNVVQKAYEWLKQQPGYENAEDV